MYICMRISLERSILIVAQQFHRELIKKYGKNPVSTDGGDGGSGTWYPQACRFLKLRHHTHSLTPHIITHIITKKVSL